MNDAAYEAGMRLAGGVALIFVGCCVALSAPVVLVRAVVRIR